MIMGREVGGLGIGGYIILKLILKHWVLKM
jgi:hypothetical protein